MCDIETLPKIMSDVLYLQTSQKPPTFPETNERECCLLQYYSIHYVVKFSINKKDNTYIRPTRDI